MTCGTIDAASEAVSVGVMQAGDLMLMYGSTMFFIMLTGERVADTRLWYAPWLFPGQHASMAGLATSGTLTHWFRDQFARELDPADAFPALAAEAANSPAGRKRAAAAALFFRRAHADPRSARQGRAVRPEPDAHARRHLSGAAGRHRQGTAHVIDTWREIGQAPRKVFAVGGGVKNTVWSQAISDIAGVTQIVRKRSTGASFGNAFLAALAVGDVEAGDISKWNPVEGEIAPRAELAELHARQTAYLARHL